MSIVVVKLIMFMKWRTSTKMSMDANISIHLDVMSNICVLLKVLLGLPSTLRCQIVICKYLSNVLISQ